MMTAEADVGHHSGAGKQAHIPLEVLDALNAEVGHKLRFEVEEGKAIITVLAVEDMSEEERRKAAVVEFGQRISGTLDT